MKLTVLGCGASLGTPNAGGFWGACDPNEPKNFRTRASILVQSEKSALLVDATVDLRMHLIRHHVKNLDGVLLSHAHSDHVNGLDELKAIAFHNNKMIDLYGDRETLEEVERRWPYLFNKPDNNIYHEFMRKNVIGRFDKFNIGDIEVQALEQDHTTCLSIGFRFGKIAYCVDVARMGEKSLEVLKGVETLVVDACSYNKEVVLTHANIAQVKQWVDILKPKMTYLTVLTSHMDYQTLCNELPPHIRPAYDGLVIDTETNQR